MFQIFYPDAWIDSTYEIDFDALRKRGIRGVIFDIDNTLVPHGAPADARAVVLFAHLKEIGIDACLLSNNQEPRVKPFADQVGAHYIFNAHKPSVPNYENAMACMHTNRASTVFVGDQLFTDVFGANRAGIPTILVKPIHPKEEIQIVLKRYLERIVLFFYKRAVKNGKHENSIVRIGSRQESGAKTGMRNNIENGGETDGGNE